jgi:hypothetical protein
VSRFELQVGHSGRRGQRPLLQADVGGIEPANDRFEPEELRIGDEHQRQVVFSCRRLDLRVALHDLDHVPAVDLQVLVDVGPRHLQGDQHLDHELVARGRHEVGRGAKPLGQLALAGRRDPVPLPRPFAFPVVGLDEPVPFEALEGGVHLPDVERPDLARSGLELVLKSEAVLRPFAQQSKEGVWDAHERLQRTIILSTILGIYRSASRRRVDSPAQRRRSSDEPIDILLLHPAKPHDPGRLA